MEACTHTVTSRYQGRTMTGGGGGAPSVGLVPDTDCTGYWIAGDDGSVRAVDAPDVEPADGWRPRYLVRDVARFGDGYLMVAENGDVFASGSLAGPPSLRATPGDRPFAVFVAVATIDDSKRAGQRAVIS